MPAVYDEEKEKEGIKPSHDGSHDDLGESPEQRETETKKLDDLYNSESAPESGSGGKAENQEQGKLDDQAGNGYTGDDKPDKKGGWLGGRKKQGVIAGALVSLAVAGGGMGMLAAPNFIVNHLRELLLGKISQLQTHQTRRYRRKRMAKIKDLFSTDGRRTSKMITDMETRGYTFDFGKPRGKDILGIKPPGASDFIRGEDMGVHLEEYMEIRHPLRSARWKTNRMEAFFRRHKIPRKSPVAAGQDYDDPDKQMNKTLAKEALDEADMKAKANQTDVPEDATDDAIEKSDEEIKEMIQSDGSLDDIKRQISEGTALEDLSDMDRRLARMGVDYDDELAEMLAHVADDAVTAGSVFKSVKGAVATTDILDRICTVKKRLQGVVLAARLFRARSLLRLAASFVKASDDTRRGNVDPKLMNALFKRVTATDSNGNPIGASPGMAYIMKNKFSKSSNNNFKGSFGVDGKLSGPMKTIQDKTNIPGCDVFQNVFFQVGVGVVEIGAAFFTGGGSGAATTGAKEAFKVAVKEAIEKGITRQMVKRGLLEIGKTVAVELTFEMAMTFVQTYAEKSMSLNFTGQEKGGELGSILAGGAGTLNKQRSLQAGMVPATTAQYAQAQTEYIAWKKEEAKKMSFYERIFDYSNYDSLAFNLASTVAFMPMTPQTIGISAGNSLNQIASSLLSNPMALFGNLGNMFGGKVFAQDADEIAYGSYDAKGTSLATDPAGNVLPIMTTSIEDIDPEENIKNLVASGDIDESTLEPVKGSAFDKHLTNCVYGIDTLSVIENEDQKKPEFDCLAKLNKTKRFKAHLAYLDMVDGLDAEFLPQEIGANTQSGSSQTANSGPIVTGGGAGTIPIEQTSEIPGSGGRRIATDILPQFMAMVAHAQRDGINLMPISSAYRDQASQIALRKQNCGANWRDAPSSSCRPPTAKPGTSYHESGRAIDFGNMCFSKSGSTACPGNARWEWLKKNANQYGFTQLKTEAWHWSVGGR